jgi:hypothetical protein
MKNKNWRSAGWCETHQKHYYATRKIARGAARQHHAEHKSAFRCDQWWHIGELPRVIVKGEFSRQEVFRDVA